MPHVTCPKGHRLQVADRHIGQVVKCPSCQSSFIAQNGGEAFEFDENDRSENKGSPRASRGVKDLPEGVSIVSLANSFVGKPLLVFGLIFVILGRGCDATSMRSVSWTEAHYRQGKVAFQLEWESKLSVIQQKLDRQNRLISDLPRSLEKRDDEFRTRMNELQNEKISLERELTKSRLEHSSALAENENGAWKPLREASLKASTDHRMAIYWYEWAFIIGTIVLVLGVLTLAFTGQGAERWSAYIMIAIITFSIYVGGAAWIESVINSAGSAMTLPLERPSPFPR